jgi:hypothetical protein
MKLTHTALAFLLVATVGCSKKEGDKATDKAKEETPVTAPTKDEKDPGPTTATEPTEPAEPTKPATVTPATALASTSDKKTRCESSCLLLTELPFEKIADGGYCTQCKAYDEEACNLDWPSSDVMECDEWDAMRNCVYAAYGNTFAKKKWQEHFGKLAWYKSVAKIDAAALPKVAVENIRFLKEKADKCRKFQP